jgi:hypothetical protein
MKVFAYRNLHQGCISLKALEGDHKGRVIAHVRQVILTDVQPRVSESGRQKVIREKSKNVHAGLIGHLQAWDIQSVRYEAGWMNDIQACQESQNDVTALVSYNPYRFGYFFSLTPLNPLKRPIRCVWDLLALTSTENKETKARKYMAFLHITY